MHSGPEEPPRWDRAESPMPNEIINQVVQTSVPECLRNQVHYTVPKRLVHSHLPPHPSQTSRGNWWSKGPPIVPQKPAELKGKASHKSIHHVLSAMTSVP